MLRYGSLNSCNIRFSFGLVLSLSLSLCLYLSKYLFICVSFVSLQKSFQFPSIHFSFPSQDFIRHETFSLYCYYTTPQTHMCHYVRKSHFLFYIYIYMYIYIYILKSVALHFSLSIAWIVICTSSCTSSYLK